MLPQWKSIRRPASLLMLFIIGVSLASVAKSRSLPKSQKCGDTQTIWQNTTSQTMTVTATFTANCNEPEETGEVSVYTESGVQVIKITFPKGASQTFTFDVSGKGHIDYVCRPAHNTAQDDCSSHIDAVRAKRNSASSK
jgi:hypothetical protein